jgi:MOSC domain-containing protein YiiM
MGADLSKPPGAAPPVAWTEDDVAGTARAAELWWGLIVAGVDPVPEVLGGNGDHVSQMAGAMLSPIDLAERAALADALLALLSASARAVHDAGHGPGPAVGSVEGVFASGGGVPKQPVLAAEVSWRGLVGDRQAARRHHGRVWQALCLWSADVVDALADEGHPIFYGAAGENVSVRGIDWAALRPGTRLRLGSVLAEVTVPALPCAKNAGWFRDRDFDRMHHERDRSVTRWYASVLEPGSVAPGDAAVVEPGA